MVRLLEHRDRHGLTYDELSEESGVAAHTLSWWSWKLRREARERTTFVELEISDSESDATFEVEAPNGLVVRVPTHFDAAALGRLLETLTAC